MHLTWIKEHEPWKTGQTTHVSCSFVQILSSCMEITWGSEPSWLWFCNDMRFGHLRFEKTTSKMVIFACPTYTNLVAFYLYPFYTNHLLFWLNFCYAIGSCIHHWAFPLPHPTNSSVLDNSEMWPNNSTHVMTRALQRLHVM